MRGGWGRGPGCGGGAAGRGGHGGARGSSATSSSSAPRPCRSSPSAGRRGRGDWPAASRALPARTGCCPGGTKREPNVGRLVHGQYASRRRAPHAHARWRGWGVQSRSWRRAAVLLGRVLTEPGLLRAVVQQPKERPLRASASWTPCWASRGLPPATGSSASMFPDSALRTWTRRSVRCGAWRSRGRLA